MVASILASRIATIDRNSFNFKVKTKRYYIGHGITYPDFYLKSKPTRLKYELVMVGRISAIKRIEFLIKALSILKEKLNIDFNLNLYGDTITKKDLVYKNKLKNLVLACGISSNVIFHGSKPNNEIANHIMLCDLAFNLSVDGGMDKAGLEAMAIGIPLIYTNSSYNKIFIDLNMDYSKYYVSKLSYSKLADKIEPFLKNQHKNIRLPKLLISHIRTEYSVDALISRLTPILKMK
jgi:glycosyltransferase involved in cell wall biosynthesis